MIMVYKMHWVLMVDCCCFPMLCCQMWASFSRVSYFGDSLKFGLSLHYIGVLCILMFCDLFAFISVATWSDYFMFFFCCCAVLWWNKSFTVHIYTCIFMKNERNSVSGIKNVTGKTLSPLKNSISTKEKHERIMKLLVTTEVNHKILHMHRHAYMMRNHSRCQAVTELRHSGNCCPHLTVKCWEIRRVDHQDSHNYQARKHLLISAPVIKAWSFNF